MILAIQRLLQGKHLHTAAGIVVRAVRRTSITDDAAIPAKLV